ncbi:MAG: T9SS type A sorting domain-containing protein [Flavobacteriales bacterium]|nr:T9SS type A sorting domain-containing protein [Flavobacteriales bacterium]
MRSTLLLVLLLDTTPGVFGQTYFYVDEIQVSPAAPTTSDAITLSFMGNFSGGGVYVTSVTHQVVGNLVYVQINCADLGGITVLIPHTEQVVIGQLPAGSYGILLSGTGTDDLAPTFQHSFNVSGASACDSLIVHSLTWSAFSGDHVELHVANASTTLFDYPGFVLLDPNGDTLAVETVNYFGIATDSWHALTWHPSAAIPTGAFTGSLHLWTGFYDTFACSWPVNVDLCPPGPCIEVHPFLQNIGGALVTASVPWAILDEDQTTVATGLFGLSGSTQFDLDTVCLEPGSYALVTYLTSPVGGQLQFGMQATMASSFAIPLVQDAVPDTATFTFFEHCEDGTNGISPDAATGIEVRYDAEGWWLATNAGMPIDQVELWNATGQRLRSDRHGTQQVHLSSAGLAPGIYIVNCTLQSGQLVSVKLVKTNR